MELSVSPGVIKREANLYAYIIDKDEFESVALSMYFCSGKFDKNSLARWAHGEIVKNKYKAQHIRASIDNTVVFLPVGKSAKPFEETLGGNLILLCYRENDRTVVAGVGIITNSLVKCPDEYKISKNKFIMPVHVLSTSVKSEITLETLTETLGNKIDTVVTQSDYLPKNVFNIVTNLSETADLDVPTEVSVEYEKQILYAHAFRLYLSETLKHDTPVPMLEQERRKRLMGINYHIKTKKSLKFPPTRRAPQKPSVSSFESVMKLHSKYATMFGKLLKPNK